MHIEDEQNLIKLPINLKVSLIINDLVADGYTDEEIGSAFLTHGDDILEEDLMDTLVSEYCARLDKKVVNKSNVV